MDQQDKLPLIHNAAAKLAGAFDSKNAETPPSDADNVDALKEGASAEQIAALKAWQVSPLFDAAERAALAYTDTMTRDIQVPDELFAEVEKHFDTQDLVELTATVAGYNLVSRFLEAMLVGHQD